MLKRIVITRNLYKRSRSRWSANANAKANGIIGIGNGSVGCTRSIRSVATTGTPSASTLSGNCSGSGDANILGRGGSTSLNRGLLQTSDLQYSKHQRQNQHQWRRSFSSPLLHPHNVSTTITKKKYGNGNAKGSGNVNGNGKGKLFHLPLPTQTKKGYQRPTPSQVHSEMQRMAMTLQSLKDPRIYASFLSSVSEDSKMEDDTEDTEGRRKMNTHQRLLFHSQKVIKYYAKPDRTLPLMPNSNSTMNTNSSNSNSNKNAKANGMVLMGPQYCHSLLISVLLPHFATQCQAQRARSNIDIDDEDLLSYTDLYALIDMTYQTIQSLGKLSDMHGQNKLQKAGGKHWNHHRNNGGNGDVNLDTSANNSGSDSAIQYGELAEGLLRSLLNAPLLSPRQYNDDDDATDLDINLSRYEDEKGYGSNSRSRSNSNSNSDPQEEHERRTRTMKRRNTKLLNNLYNNTLHTWSVIAASDRDPNRAKDAAQRAERLLLDLAMSKRITNSMNGVGSGDGDGNGVHVGKMDGNLSLLKYIQPNVTSFNTVISAWMKSARFRWSRGGGASGRQQIDVTTVSAAERAESILNILQELYDDNLALDATDEILPDRMSYDFVINAWSRALDENAPHRAMRLLENMLERYQNAYDAAEDHFTLNEQSKNIPPFPSNRTFSNLLKVWSKSKHPDAVEKAEEIFGNMEALAERGYVENEPDTIAYNALMTVYSNHVTNLLEDEVQAHVRDKNLVSSDALKLAYKCTQRMDEIVRNMKSTSDRKNQNRNSITKETTQPDIVSYKILLQTYLDVGKNMLGREEDSSMESLKVCAHASRILFMKYLKESKKRPAGKTLLKTAEVSRCFSGVYNLLVAAGKMQEAKEFLQFGMQSQGQGLNLDASVYENMIRQSMHSKGVNGVASSTFIDDAGDILKSFHYSGSVPSVGVYNSFIEALSDSPERADKIMTQMVDSYHKALADMIDGEGGNPKSAARPNTFSLHSVLSAYSKKCKNASSMEERNRTVGRMEEILALMESMHKRRMEAVSNPRVKNFIAKVVPNTISYNLLLNAYLSLAKQSNDEAEIMHVYKKAESLFDRMHEDHNPGYNTKAVADKHTYSTMFSILGEVKSTDANDKSMKLLERSISTKGKTMDIVELNSALKSLSIEQAESILEQLQDGSLSSTTTTLVPTKVTYTTVMAGLAELQTFDAAKKAEALYQQMLERYQADLSDNSNTSSLLKPDIRSYNTLIEAYSNVGSQESHEYAERLLNRLLYDDASIGPDNDSFSAIFKGLAKGQESTSAMAYERILSKKEKYQEENPSRPVQLVAFDYLRFIGQDSGCNDAEISFRLLHKLLRSLNDGSLVLQSWERKKLSLACEAVMKSLLRKNSEESLNRIDELYELTFGRNILRPCPFAMSILMNAHAQSRLPNSVLVVNSLLDKIIEEDKGEIKPTIHFFNILFKACEVSTPSQNDDDNVNPLQIAFQKFRQIQESEDLNIDISQVTYNHIFAICHNHIHKDNRKREDIVLGLLEKCCSEGKLSSRGLKLCQKSISKNRLAGFLNKKSGKRGINFDMTYGDLPREWKRNALR